MVLYNLHCNPQAPNYVGEFVFAVARIYAYRCCLKENRRGIYNVVNLLQYHWYSVILFSL